MIGPAFHGGQKRIIAPGAGKLRSLSHKGQRRAKPPARPLHVDRRRAGGALSAGSHASVRKRAPEGNAAIAGNDSEQIRTEPGARLRLISEFPDFRISGFLNS